MAAADEATWKSCAQFCRQARGLIMSRGIEYTSWLQVVTLDLRPETRESSAVCSIRVYRTYHYCVTYVLRAFGTSCSSSRDQIL